MAPIKINKGKGSFGFYIHKDLPSLAFQRIGMAGSAAVTVCYKAWPGLENLLKAITI